MSFLQPHPLRTPFSLFKPCPLFLPRSLSFFHEDPFHPRKILSLHISCSSPNVLPIPEKEFLESVSESEGKTFPCVRSYETDLARLTVVGAVDREQAVTAAAADGGEAATEHVDAGLPAMVVETIYPGPLNEHSTVSTRLFLPAKKVKEKAKKLRRSLTEDMLSSTTSRNILAMTFRQVVLQQLWNFELISFPPGTERNMEDLENPREVPASFTLSSSDKHVISRLAEVVCTCALENTKRQIHEKSTGKALVNFFHWFSWTKRIASKDSSFIVYKLFEDEIIGDVKGLLDNFNSVKKNYMPVKMMPKHTWWSLPAYCKLEKIGGPEFSQWACEYLPAYRLQIDATRLKNIKFEGWKKSAENRWEVLLTHSQMLGLANILDMYFEDMYTLPDNEFSCGMDSNPTNISKSKRSSSVLNMLSLIIATGVFLATISVLGQLCLPHIQRGTKAFRGYSSVKSSESHCPQIRSPESTESEHFCISVVRKIKDALGWSGDIMRDINIGAWIGEPPIYLMRVSEAEDSLMRFASLENAEIRSSAQDIASYQVVLSTDGRLVGFQPTNRVAVNRWAANPLSKELYGGRKLSPGLMEPGLKIECPKEVIAIELLMSTNPDARFALARPLHVLSELSSVES